MSDITKEALELLLSTGRAQQSVNENLAGDPFFITPAGEATELKEFFPPRRIEQNVVLLDAGSFIEYVNRFKDQNTLIFANVTEEAADFTAVLDYHKAKVSAENDGNAPRYCAHIAKFSTIPTPEWKIWRAANRKQMNQVEFATWLEDNMQIFVVPKTPEGVNNTDFPTGSDLLELVRSLHGHQNARFNTALRLDNGAYSTHYDEDVVVRGTSTTQTGGIELPPHIAAGFSVFQGADKYLVTARLKTRITDRKLVLFFETINMPAIVRESIMAVTKKIGDETKIVPMLGNV